MSWSWKGGSTRAWRKLRRRILERDKWKCRIRLPGTCTVKATCVHHTQGKAITGDDPRFLVAACKPCNLAIGDPQKRPDPRPQPRTRW